MSLDTQKETVKGPGPMSVPGSGITSVKEALSRAKIKSQDANPPAAKATSTITPVAKTAKVVRPSVDDAWIAGLVDRANRDFSDGLPEGSTIEFTVAKSKGRPVSLTPRIILADGSVQTAGPKSRLGFGTDSDWAKWGEKLKEALSLALSKAPRSKGTEARTASSKPSRWTAITALRDQFDPALLGPEKISIKSIGRRLIISRETENEDRALKIGLHREEGQSVQTSSATGPLVDLAIIYQMVQAALIAESAAEPVVEA